MNKKQTFKLMVQIDDSHWRGRVIQIEDEDTLKWLNYHLDEGFRVTIDRDCD